MENEIQAGVAGDSPAASLLAELKRTRTLLGEVRHDRHELANRCQVAESNLYMEREERAELEDELMRVRAELDELRRAVHLVTVVGTRVRPVAVTETRGGLWGVSGG